jgi:hypothetical protein
MRIIFLASCLIVLCLAHGISTPLRSNRLDPVSEWSQIASKAADASGVSPFHAPVTLAIVHVAMFDAITAVAGHRRPNAVGEPVGRQTASPYAAAVEAGYRILVAEFPQQRAMLDAAHVQLLTGEPDSLEKRAGIEVGAAVAERMLAARANDGRKSVVPYTPAEGMGNWQPTPPGFLSVTTAFLSKVTPLTMTSPSQFRPAGPPRVGSPKWAADYKEVKALGVKERSARTPAQTATALFWAPLAGTVWIPTIRRLANEQALDLESSARFQAAAFAALADALIACWDAKLHFDFWRPVTAIQTSAGNSSGETGADAAWEPLGVTPNFPEYPSGHACASAAVAHTIENFLPGVGIPAKNVTTGEERVYRKAAQVVDEVIDARMLLGVHFRSANQDGAEIGRRIAEQIRRTWLP